MPEPPRVTPAIREQRAEVQIARLAARQSGAVSRTQLERCGLSRSAITRRVRAGALHPVHRGVYAVGHPGLGIEGRLHAALLYVPDSMLSHTTAAWWWQLTKTEPRRIHFSGPRRWRSTSEICVHHVPGLEGTVHRGHPVTTVERTLLDLAAVRTKEALRRAPAEADHLGLLDPAALQAILGRGRPGSAALRSALDDHNPRLAHTLSVLEERFLTLCESRRVPMPEVNAKVQGLMVDALWREQRLVVELDGHRSHATPSAIERDRHRELVLRGSGYRVLRYTWRQVTTEPAVVASDLRRALGII
jgi:very-short-patch-repair endonuclease/predicted transcriptional regulator of viral defense system